MMPIENVTFSKEEAHWSSFRSAVAGLQHVLTELSYSAEVKMERTSTGRELYGRDVNSSSASSRNAPTNEPQSIVDDVCDENSIPCDPPQDISKNRWDGGNIEINRSLHRHLELIGLEEVDKSEYSMGNHHDGNELAPPAHSSAHSSHATIALSMASQQLAEARLKLAFTESERDELEFRLMQAG
jgi:hypothetical protein